MNGAHILSQLRNVPSHICDISTIDGCNFQSDTTRPSLFYFHPLIFFFPPALTLYAFSLPTLPFSEFLLLATSCYQPFMALTICLFIFFFTPFAILLFFYVLHFITFFSACLSYMSVPLCSNLSLPWSSSV